MTPIEIQVTYDFICPWCWISHEHLKSALKAADLAAPVVIRYVPYELNPTMPKDGVNRNAYRSAKFGTWARSQVMDADVTLAGQRAGLAFNYDRVAITPNTRLAHRLMFFAQGKGVVDKTALLFETIFAAYFSEGQDIGAVDVLVKLAERTGFDAEAVRSFLVTSNGEREVAEAELQAQTAGVRSVPTIRIGDVPISGAQPPSVWVQLLHSAASDKTAEAAG